MFYTFNLKKIVSVVLIILLIIVIALFINNMKNNMTISSSSIMTNVEWGFVRGKDGKQPTFEKKYIDILNQFDGIYVGNSNTPNIYLTFDEGYENGYTSQILDILKENNVPAAFFITGDYAKKNSTLIQRMIDDGHILGNHSMSHPSFNKFKNEIDIKNEVCTLDDHIYKEYGYKMTYFRPAKGEYNEYNLEVIQSLGYKTVLWSFAYDDWDVNKQNREEYCKNKIVSNMHNGAVLLLHAVSKDNANILDEVIKTLIDDGYVFKSLDDI